MGDVILTSSIVRSIKLQTGATIHFLIKPAFAELVQHNPNISKVFTLSKDLKSTSKELLKENYDTVIDLQKNRKSTYLSRSLNVPRITFSKVNVKKWILVQSGIDLLPKIHLIDRYYDALSEVGVKNDGKGSEMFIPKSTADAVSLLHLPENYVVIGIGAQHQGKCMSEHQLTHVINTCKQPIVLLGGTDELDLSNRLNTPASNGSIINLVGKTTILESAEITRLSSVVISGDTGIMHMASAFCVPQISIWGCTSPAFGMYPYLANKDSILLEPMAHSKRPCSKLGNRCKYAPDWCIQSIDPVRISTALDLILKKQGF